MTVVDLPKLHCERCGHDWVPRQTDVRRCPECGSVYFDLPWPPTDGKG